MEIYPHSNFDTLVGKPDIEVMDQHLLTSQQNNPTTNTAEPVLLPITEAELQLAQRHDQLCVSIRRRLKMGEGLLFALKETFGPIFRAHTGDEQLVIPSSLQDTVLRLSH